MIPINMSLFPHQQRSSHHLHFKVTHSYSLCIIHSTFITLFPYQLPVHFIDQSKKETKQKDNAGFLSLFRRKKKKPEWVNGID